MSTPARTTPRTTWRSSPPAAPAAPTRPAATVGPPRPRPPGPGVHHLGRPTRHLRARHLLRTVTVLAVRSAAQPEPRHPARAARRERRRRHHRRPGPAFVDRRLRDRDERHDLPARARQPTTSRVDGVGNGTGTTGYTDYASSAPTRSPRPAATRGGTAPAPTDLQCHPSRTGTSATVSLGRAGLGRRQPRHGLHRRGRTGAATRPRTVTKTWTGLTPGVATRSRSGPPTPPAPAPWPPCRRDDADPARVRRGADRARRPIGQSAT